MATAKVIGTEYKFQKISNGGMVVLEPVKGRGTAVMYVEPENLVAIAAGASNAKFKAAVKLDGGERAKALREIESDLRGLRVVATLTPKFEA